jgi:anhydro-N-acetylmuramic acid kinase
METYHAIGIMSGSSLDGVDVAYCKFNLKEKKWSFTIIKSATYPLGIWANILKSASDLNAQDLVAFDFDFGSFLGKIVKDFINEHSISQIDLIASHGHTIFHHPTLGFTCQIGNGNAIAKETSHPVVTDLRSADIVAGGQGAPIVPIGDFHLFKEHAFCLNIGGIANISYKTEDEIRAFDICSANQILNFYANQKGKEYDENGVLASKGIINKTLLKTLNQIDYYKKKAPKSLDNSFSQKSIEIMEGNQSLSVEDKLATYIEHMAIQINLAVESCSKKNNQQSILVTGGGAFNQYLIKRIKANSKLRVHIPSIEVINFKEAMVMAFMGVLRQRNEINCFASVTGASKNTSCGVIFQP